MDTRKEWRVTTTSRQLAFSQLLSDCLRDLGFYPSKAESSIFMQKCPTRDVYEYAATYVDNLCIIMEDQETFLNSFRAITDLARIFTSKKHAIKKANIDDDL
jgi:hypothetical protein